MQKWGMQSGKNLYLQKSNEDVIKYYLIILEL